MVMVTPALWLDTRVRLMCQLQENPAEVNDQRTKGRDRGAVG